MFDIYFYSINFLKLYHKNPNYKNTIFLTFSDRIKRKNPHDIDTKHNNTPDNNNNGIMLLHFKILILC